MLVCLCSKVNCYLNRSHCCLMRTWPSLWLKLYGLGLGSRFSGRCYGNCLHRRCNMFGGGRRDTAQFVGVDSQRINISVQVSHKGFISLW